MPRVGGRAYYGWVVLGVAALAMVGTLPGRTQGLGLITEPLMRDLGFSRVVYAQVNLVATLIGALVLYRRRPADRSAGQPHRADGDRGGAGARRAGDEPGELAGRPVDLRDADPRLRPERAVGGQSRDGGQVVSSPIDRAQWRSTRS